MVNQYHYPDGSSYSTKPHDGQLFYHHDSNGNLISIYQYDDIMDFWVDLAVTHNQNYSHHKGYSMNMGDTSEKLGEYSKQMSQKKCECGASKVGASVHSSWCELA